MILPGKTKVIARGQQKIDKLFSSYPWPVPCIVFHYTYMISPQNNLMKAASIVAFDSL